MTDNDSKTTDQTHPGFSSQGRIVASVVIAAYLVLMILAPLSRPVASDNLTRPLAEITAPFHQALYLGHGYRFFGPNPGPGHLLIYKVFKDDQIISEGQFPDRTQHWPRLLYHRWFMLSETIYNEHFFASDDLAFQEEQNQLRMEVEQQTKAGAYELVELLERQIKEREQQHSRTSERIRVFVKALEEHLKQKHDGDRIDLFVQERLLPEPMDIRIGVELTDPRFLSPPYPIGSAAERVPSVEDLPATTTSELDGGVE